MINVLSFYPNSRSLLSFSLALQKKKQQQQQQKKKKEKMMKRPVV